MLICACWTMLAGWGWTGGRADRAAEAVALGVSVTISYVSGGAHSPLYNTKLVLVPMQDLWLENTYSLLPPCPPTPQPLCWLLIAPRLMEIDGRDKWLSQWASLRVVDAHPECIFLPLWVLAVACMKPFLKEHTSEMYLWFDTGFLPRDLKSTL